MRPLLLAVVLCWILLSQQHTPSYSLLQIGPFVPVPKGYLYRFWNRDKAAGTKALLSRVVEPGQNVPRTKKSLLHAGFEPKTYCLAHGFLANSTK